MKTVYHDVDLKLTAPMVLASNTEIRGGQITLDPSFAPGGRGVVQCAPGALDIVVDGVTVDPGEKWAFNHPTLYPLYGFEVVSAGGVVISRCRARNLLASGYYLRDFTSVQLLDCEADRCNSALGVDWPRTTGNKGLTVDGMLGIDMRSVRADLNAIGPSLLAPDRWVGTNFAWGLGVESGLLRNMRCVGEGKEIKFNGCNHMTFERLRAPGLWVGGALGYPDGWKGPATCAFNLVKDCVLGESTFGFSKDKTSDAIALVVDGPFVDTVTVQNTMVIAPRPGAFTADWGSDLPDFRYQAVAVQRGASLTFGTGVRLVDLNGDKPEPLWISIDDRSQFHDSTPPAPRERYTPHWHAP